MTSNVQLVGLEPGLSRQDTLLASDIWTESCQGVSCLPTPIPSRIEPSISFQVYNKPVGDDIDNLTPPSTPRSLPWTLQLADVDKVDKDIPTSVTLESGLQVGIFCTFNLHIPTYYVLRSQLYCLVRIPCLLVTLFGRNPHLSLACQL